MKYAAIAVVTALSLLAILQFSSGEWQWHWPQKQQATIINAHQSTPRHRSELERKQAVAQPAPTKAVRTAEVIQGTPDSVYRLPSMYAHRFVMLDEWKVGWLRKVSSSNLPANTLAKTISDCDWYLAFSVNAGACMSSGEIEHVKQMAKNQQNVWGVPTADLLCYVEVARFAEGFLLTHCRPVAVPMDVEIYRESQRNQEQEMQNALSDLELDIERAERAGQ